MPKGLQQPDRTQRGPCVPPPLVRVHRYACLGPCSLPHRRYTDRVPLRHVAHLNLEDTDALCAHRPCLLGKDLRLVPAQGYDLRQPVSAASAEEIAQGSSRRLTPDVPQRHLEPGARSLVADHEEIPLPVVHDLFDVERVLAQDGGAEVLADHVLDRPQRVARELVGGTGFAVSGHALVGLYGDQVARTDAHGRRRDHERLREGKFQGVDMHGCDLHGAPPGLVSCGFVPRRAGDDSPVRLRRNAGIPYNRIPPRTCVRRRGALAQLGERLDRTQEVSGSNPLCSTTSRSTGLRPNPAPALPDLKSIRCSGDHAPRPPRGLPLLVVRE